MDKLVTILDENGRLIKVKLSSLRKEEPKKEEIEIEDLVLEHPPKVGELKEDEIELAPLPENLEELSSIELKLIASERGIDYKGNISKRKLIELLTLS